MPGLPPGTWLTPDSRPPWCEVTAAGRFADWHPAPRRQMIATLGGWGEVETGDGQRLRLTPGVLVVVEDVAGVGHKTWTHPTEGCQMLFIPLDDATTLP